MPRGKKTILPTAQEKNGRTERLGKIRIWISSIRGIVPLRPMRNWSYASLLKLERKYDARLSQNMSFLTTVAHYSCSGWFFLWFDSWKNKTHRSSQASRFCPNV